MSGKISKPHVYERGRLSRIEKSGIGKKTFWREIWKRKTENTGDELEN